MSTMASQISSLTTVYSTVYSRRKSKENHSSASLAFVRGIRRWPVISSHKGPVTLKMFPFDDVIMCDIFLQDRRLLGTMYHRCGLRGDIFPNDQRRLVESHGTSSVHWKRCNNMPWNILNTPLFWISQPSIKHSNCTVPCLNSFDVFIHSFISSIHSVTNVAKSKANIIFSADDVTQNPIYLHLILIIPCIADDKTK